MARREGRTGLATTARQDLIRAGVRAFARQGYEATGLADILERAGLPKGSFYHQFASKEAFGEEVARAWFDAHAVVMRGFLDDAVRPASERVAAYFEHMCEDMRRGGFACGCLVGTLGQELADRSEPMRRTLSMLFAAWRQALADCLREGQSAGNIPLELPAGELAEILLCAWEGALLRAKTDRDYAPMRAFLRLVRHMLGQSDSR